MTTFNTGNPLGSTDVYDRYDNSENLDNFSNGPLDAYPDRFGVSRQSLQGIRNASQYVRIGAYAAGLNFTSFNQVFSFDGEFYAPGPSIVLPYTTTGIGAAEIANFRSVGDAILRSELKEIFVTPEQFGGPTPLQSAADAAGGKTLLLPGDYVLTTGVTLQPNTRVLLTGTVDMSGCPTSAAAFAVAGSEGTAYLLTANATVDAFTASLNPANLAASGIVAGDWVRVCSDGIFDPARTSSKIGEIISVESIDLGTGVVTFDAPLVDGYLTADAATMNKIMFVDGVRFDGGGTIFSDNTVTKLHKGIQINLALAPYIGAIKYEKIDDRAIWLQDSIHAKITDPYFYDSLSSGTGYGVSVVNACQDVVVTGMRSFKVRHAFSTNNSTTTKGIPRRITVDGFAVDVSAKTSGGAGGDAMDTHAAAEHVNFSNGTIRGASGIGFNIECPSATVRNVSVDGSASHSVNIQNYSGRPGKYSVSGVRSKRAGGDGVRVTPTGADIEFVHISDVQCFDAAQLAVNINGNASKAINSIELDGISSARHGSAIGAVNVSNVTGGFVRSISALDGLNTAGFGVRLRDCENVGVSGVSGRLPAGSTGGMVYFNGSAPALCLNNIVDGIQGESPSAVSSRGVLVDNNCQGITVGQKNDFGSFSTKVSWGTGTGHKGGFLTGSTTYDPPSIAAGAETTTTVAVTGAALGDLASASFSLALGGLALRSEITSANTVTVAFRNNTGSPIDIGSGTLRVQVQRI